MPNHTLVRKALKCCTEGLCRKANVVGTGLGEKITQGVSTGHICVLVFVSKKHSCSHLEQRDIVPAKLMVGSDSVDTDVVEIGDIKALATPYGAEVSHSIHTERHRPCPAGVSVGHYLITAGTFGCVVQDKETGERLILSNNHVLANSNEAVVGDEILQPGNYDGGVVGIDKIGTLLRFVPIDFGEGVDSDCSITLFIVKVLNYLAAKLNRDSRFSAKSMRFAAGNIVDAAVARPTETILDEVIGNGVPRGTATGSVGMRIKKTGRTTGFTEGEIRATDVTVNVDYGGGNVATFTDQFLAGAMSAGGDSGSAILDEMDHFVGLLFAGSDSTTIICPGRQVLDFLNVAI